MDEDDYPEDDYPEDDYPEDYYNDWDEDGGGYDDDPCICEVCQVSTQDV